MNLEDWIQTKLQTKAILRMENSCKLLKFQNARKGSLHKLIAEFLGTTWGKLEHLPQYHKRSPGKTLMSWVAMVHTFQKKCSFKNIVADNY